LKLPQNSKKVPIEIWGYFILLIIKTPAEEKMAKGFLKKGATILVLLIFALPQFPIALASEQQGSSSWAIQWTRDTGDYGIARSLDLASDGSIFVSYTEGDFSLTKINPQGQVIWNRKIIGLNLMKVGMSGISLDNPSSVVSLPDGRCLLANGSLIFAFSEDGQLLWSRFYETFQDSYWLPLYFRSLSLMPDGNLLAAGPLGFDSAFVLCLNQDGSIAWGNTYNLVWGGVIPRSPSGYWLVGNSLGYGSADQYNGIKLIAITEKGDIERSLIISDDLRKKVPTYGWLAGACTAPEGDLFLGQVRYDRGFGVTFIRLSSDGEKVVWTKWLGGDLGAGAGGVFTIGADQTSDGGAVFCGGTTDFDGDNFYNTENPLIVKVSPEGSLDFIETVGDVTKKGELVAVKALPDGGAAFLGYYDQPPLLIRMEGDGSISGLNGWLNWVEQIGANRSNPTIRIQTPEIFITPGFAERKTLTPDALRWNARLWTKVSKSPYWRALIPTWFSNHFIPSAQKKPQM
jgi:hypothetical protein